MNREIKFMGVNPYNKKVMGVSVIDWMHDEVYFDRGSDVSYPINESSLMQYTGLKDKNGVEIYDGYIVKSTPRDGKGTGVFKIAYDSVYGAYVAYFIKWCCLNVSSPESYPLDEARFDIEIIGNVYENPELLNP